MTATYFDDDTAPVAGIYDRRLAARLWRFVRPYRRSVYLSTALMVLAAGLELVPPLIVREVIDNQIAQGRTDTLAEWGGVLLAVLAAILATRYVQAVVMAIAAQRVIMDLRLALFAHLQRMSVAFFDRNPVGRLTTRLTNDVQVLDQVISHGLVEAITNLLGVSAIVVVLLVLDWRLALILYATLPPLIYIVRRFANAQRGAFREQRVWLARINAYLNELITGVTIVQLFNRQRRNLDRFDERNQGHLDSSLRILFWYAVFEPTVVMFGAVTTGLILWFGGGRVVQDALSLGTLVAFITYMARFYWPIRILAEQYTTLQEAMAATERITGLLDEPETILDVDDPLPLGEIQGRVEFRHVWFAYTADNWVVRDLSFTVEPGERVAVVGATGAGKSTLIHLLNRFYDVQRGTILVDGKPIRHVRQRELRRNVGIVLQDPFMLTDTLRENVRLRDDTIDDDAVRAAVEAVGADALVARLEGGYDAVLAERGANLSTGEKQLIALARVAAFNPRIVLVMDEATASIDPQTEARVQAGMQAVTQGRTALIIAHRLNTIRHVDRILVLEHGRLVESGSHDELLALGGRYARLYRLQYAEHAPA